MKLNDLEKEEFWSMTDVIFGEGFFDDEFVTTEMIRKRFFDRMAEDIGLMDSPVYQYWLNRTVRDLFERDGDVVSKSIN